METTSVTYFKGPTIFIQYVRYSLEHDKVLTSFKDLQAYREPSLGDSIGAAFVAMAFFITLVDTRCQSFEKPTMLVSGRFVHIAVLVQRPGRLDREPSTGAFGRIMALVGAIAADEEVRVEVELHVIAGVTPSRILHVVGIQTVQTVNARHRNWLVAVGEI